ncbi:hypothetical protein NP493_1693g00033 [Ridgeia piscesae]|uniref:SEA domain-containing protein n=1 Tax=Ridgeia piscesae TaxID=27915 RepID=A0AAD9JWA2_RIDPI|nr:hypothetical protein NP493_1693g00033 [Ridgeia piscesae]
MTESPESVDGTTDAPGESTEETPTTTTTPVVTTTTPLIPYTHQARVNVSIKLTSAVYTTDLAIKTSDAYKSLKTKVVDTLKEILTSKLGEGNFEIVDVTFSHGSVVVKYELAVKKETVGQTLDTIVRTVKEVVKEGSFGSFTADPNFVTATKLYSYYGRFTITNHQYSDNLAEVTSKQYQELSAEVSKQLVLKNAISQEKLVQIMKDYLGENNGKMGSFEVNAESIQFSDSRWLPAVLGSVISLVLVILIVILTIFTVRKFRKRRDHNSAESDATTIYSPTGAKRPMFWQQRSQAMPEGLNVSERYERQRMDVVSQAMKDAKHIDWSVMRNFAHRNVSQPDDMLHRDNRTSRRQNGGDEWAWTETR